MKICFVGDYDPAYIRNDVIIEGLKSSGIDWCECHTPLKTSARLFDLALSYMRKGKGADMVLVVSSDTSRWIVALMKLLTLGRKPLVWDAHYSIFDSYINDRKLAPLYSIKGAYYWFIDWMACALADVILLDTNAHVQYFVDTFYANKKKFVRVFVGSNMVKTFGIPERTRNDSDFLVSFHGKYIPLQGIQYILRAAKILEQFGDIRFKLVGSGQTYNEMRALAGELQLSNVEFTKKVPYQEIPGFLKNADVSLGIFADTDKAQRVIANKIYEAVELGVPVITSDSPGIRELFTDRKDILLCKPADPEDLAAKILLLRNDATLGSTIAAQALRLFKERVTPKKIGEQLIEDLKSKLDTHPI